MNRADSSAHNMFGSLGSLSAMQRSFFGLHAYELVMCSYAVFLMYKCGITCWGGGSYYFGVLMGWFWGLFAIVL